MPPKPKEFVIACSHLDRPGVMRHQIEVDVGIRLIEVDRRRRDLVAQGKDREPGLERTGTAEEMAGHRLGRADRQARRLLAEDPLDRPRFRLVAERRGRGVRVQVLDLLWCKARICERGEHRPRHTVAVFRRGSQVMRIGTHAVAEKLRKDGSASTASVLSFFQHQNACALADDEPVARDVPRTARARGVVVAASRGLASPQSRRRRAA